MESLMPGGADPAAEAVQALFALSALLQVACPRLGAPERERLLDDLMAEAAALRGSLELLHAHFDGPTGAQVRTELRAPTSHLVLQPIVDLSTGRPVGYEVLTRFPEWTPDCWFQRAWEIGIGMEFELPAVRSALQVLPGLDPAVYLAINVSPLTLLSRDVLRLLWACPPGRIVLELTGNDRITDYQLYRDHLRRLRHQGIRIAVDDTGAGHATSEHMAELAPDIIKLDRALIADCDQDPDRGALLAGLASSAAETGTTVVAEGVETAGETEALLSCRVTHGQGYHLGRPERWEPSGPDRLGR